MNIFKPKTKDAHKGPRILIIEDEDSIRNMYCLKLEKDGYEIYSASNANDGFDLAKSKNPNLILVDLMMPEVSGTEFLEKLRAAEWGKPMEVIVLTNLGKDEAPSELKYLGVNQYIVKSEYTPSQVEVVIREVLHIS